MNEITQQPALHAGQPVRMAGASLSQAHAAAVMLHGRGAGAADMLGLADELRLPGVAYLAPEAAGHTWYPQSFLAPLSANEPWLSSALAAVAAALSQADAAGIPLTRTVLLGFSQGACLALEYAARNAARYGGLAGLSGGLIGPEGTPRDYAGSLSGTPVFLGCSDSDPHIPAARVQETAVVLKGMGADVTLRLYPRMAHTVNEEELEAVRAMLASIA